MSPPTRWAGPVSPTGPATETLRNSTSHGHRQSSAPIPRQGQTAPSGQLELRFDEQLTTAERFERFHHRNPIVYRTLVALAREWVRRTGKRRLGIATLYERCRWDLALVTDGEDYRLNNDYKAHYARLIMTQEPDLAGPRPQPHPERESDLRVDLDPHRRVGNQHQSHRRGDGHGP